ncbi:MAG: HAD family hydrolase [Chromatiales bacterium]|nr:HAD family hydrolase [Chromatiales bacterium]
MPDRKLVCLDLDDTLWDLAPVIQRAEHGLYAWLELRYPRITARHDLTSIMALREAVGETHPAAHDLGRLRRETYRRLAREAGYPEEVANEAFAHFQTLRNEVTLYGDVLPALRRLRNRYRLVAMTNGNANLAAIGIRDWFSAVFTASGLGVAKPDPGFFLKACSVLSVSPTQLIHAGNDPEHDVAAPSRLGITAIWVNREQGSWPAHLPRTGREVSDLEALADWLGA